MVVVIQLEEVGGRVDGNHEQDANDAVKLCQHNGLARRERTVLSKGRPFWSSNALSLLGWFSVVQRVHPHQKEAERAGRKPRRCGYENGQLVKVDIAVFPQWNFRDCPEKTTSAFERRRCNRETGAFDAARELHSHSHSRLCCLLLTLLGLCRRVAECPLHVGQA